MSVYKKKLTDQIIAIKLDLGSWKGEKNATMPLFLTLISSLHHAYLACLLLAANNH
jgi:hypothetical protein